MTGLTLPSREGITADRDRFGAAKFLGTQDFHRIPRITEGGREMISVEYRVMTNGEDFRIQSIGKYRFLFRTYITYQWESWAPHYKSYKDAENGIRKMFGEQARITYRTWRPA